MAVDSFLTQCRHVIRRKHLSIRTEETYVSTIRRYIYFHGRRHPKNLNASHVSAYLTHLAVEGNVSASTQNTARCALLFLYKEILKQDLGPLDDVERAKMPSHMPAVLSKEETKRVLSHVSGRDHLMASLLYGCGMRLMECVRLRVKDVDFDRKEITIRDGKGEKDRMTMLPRKLEEPLKVQIGSARLLHEEDLKAGFGAVYLGPQVP